MDETTRATLRALNERFYETLGDTFDASRRHDWPGWLRIEVAARGDDHAPLRVLDVGCGNARFATHVRGRLGRGFVYTGVDASARMLAHAAERLAGLPDVDATLVRADVLDETAAHGWPGGDFDLVVCFGLLHHVPGRTARAALLAALAPRVAPGGCLAFTVWRFADRARFRERVRPWSALAGEGVDAPAVEAGALEPGDHLLGFADRPDALRFCHHCDEPELDALVAPLPLQPSARFSADGRSGDLNRYVVLTRSRPPC